ncbi:ABC transporter permease [Bifidobacterium sp.]|jgi:peptide/nickel transport system permease protein|uniref:ABC transporter permease n=1 Tax=Bifidobacterium sp. TaxID=41200 RepID=UPI0025C06D72|nr:ABC transporter permease [Bifidobacterium sp.]MCH4209881.1 ABC transporter permease [Bifidobacterium sp.]MCI1225542.1 ABC transporter permease [Bifidobacterium sp.]
MIKYIAKRVANYIIMLFVAISMTYFLASAFMDPRSNYMERHPHPPIASINRALDNANINDQTPIFVRYVRWLKSVLFHWDWGLAPDQSPVGAAVSQRIMASVELVTLATVLGIVIGVGIGVYTAIRQYKWQDRTLNMVATFFLVIPPAVLGLFVVLIAISFNGLVGSRIFYVTGLQSYQGSSPVMYVLDFLQHIVLPTIVITIPGAVGYHLTQRTYLLDTMNADYVRTARAKGLTLNQAIRRHALRTSLIPTTVNVAFSIASVFTGAVITETVFAINGLGRYFVTTLTTNDINGSVCIAAFGGVCTLAGALLADIFSAWLDPRIRLS